MAAPVPSDLHFYEDLFSKLITALGTYVSDVATDVIAAISPVAYTMLLIYMILWGWSMARGVISEPVTDGVGRILRLTVITAIALNLGRYNTYLGDFLWNSPDALASVVTGGAATPLSSIQFLDQLLSKMFDYGTAYYDAAWADSSFGIPDLGKLVGAVFIWLAGVAVTGYGAFLYALSKMALAIILAVGPIFVLLAIFEPTKRFFDTWIGQALNYVFMVMLTAAAVSLILAILQTYLGSAAAAGNMAATEIVGVVPAVVFSLIGLLVLMQVAPIASALGGGVAIGTLGAVGWAYGKAKSTGKGAYEVGSGKTLSNMRGARRAKAVNARWAANNPGMAAQAAGAPMAVYRKITGGRKNSVARG
ncbi:type IV secretion system protein [Sulfuriferula sp.]|uniref:type IV secretion system protein n=1 Tax=Sulfuriferula sp. TaxID=2025307 RepID=UPI002732034B|nr:type IV secretion system protein [Sulfuriferula sp.]MDP2027521.1 type IV secretion system protein [Sulfuriferula sp.]